jgi:ferredoxin
MNKNKIKGVSVSAGCISCGSCEMVCPDVFEVEGLAKIKNNADFLKNSQLIEEASQMCPVSAIKVEYEEEEN